METSERKQLIDEFKQEWKSMWQERLDDKVRAEGIANKDYSMLSVDRGTVIIATRKFKLLDFYELLQQRQIVTGQEMIPPSPSTGGWGKFIKTSIRAGDLTKRGRRVPQKPEPTLGQQLKKCGRGWLHFHKQ